VVTGARGASCLEFRAFTVGLHGHSLPFLGRGESKFVLSKGLGFSPLHTKLL
jgi:hypothetical protein